MEGIEGRRCGLHTGRRCKDVKRSPTLDSTGAMSGVDGPITVRVRMRVSAVVGEKKNSPLPLPPLIVLVGVWFRVTKHSIKRFELYVDCKVDG